MDIENYRFLKSHEWVKLDGQCLILGISDHAQDTLGELVYVELPEIGDDIEEKGEVGVVESVKAASDIYSPAQAKVSEINENLIDEPSLINDSPYESGWIVKLDCGSESGAQAVFNNLMTMQDYNAHIAD